MITHKDQDKFVVRLPEGMRDLIKDAAAANHQSMNEFIVQAAAARLEYCEAHESLVKAFKKLADKTNKQGK